MKYTASAAGTNRAIISSGSMPKTIISKRPSWRRLITVTAKKDASAIKKIAVSEGMMTMKQDGYVKVLEGVTTIEEVLRVAQY